jgi:hypothetical protein
MIRWTIVLAGLVGLGCEVGGSQPGSEITQAVSGGVCDAQMPAATVFTGQQLPIAGPRQVWVVTPSGIRDDMLAALVDTDAAKIVATINVPSNLLGELTKKISTLQAVFPGHPNPPPPVSQVTPASGSPDPSWLVLVGQRAVQGLAAAAEDAQSCAHAP